MIYDFEILVPADTGIESIKKRFIDFKKYGLMNIKDHTIRLVIAASKNNDIDFLKIGWDDKIEVVVHETPYEHIAQRIYDYYASFAKPNTAKWYVRMDEDSITDIGGLYENLERAFDSEKDYHIGGDFNDDIQDIERKILENLGFGWWLRSGVLKHEHEMSVTSRSAMEKILNGEKSKEYFKIRRQFEDGYGDHGLCLAARMNKIYHASAYFISKEPEIKNLSIFGGYLNHIHWIERERTPNILRWLDLHSESKNESNEFMKEFIEKVHVITNKNEQKGHFIKILKNNVLEIPKKPEWEKNIGLWTVKNNKMYAIMHYDNLQSFEIKEDRLESKNFIINKIK